MADLRRLTRVSQAFPLVWKENLAYGFQRNLYGMRYVGRGTSLLAALIVAGVLGWRLATGAQVFGIEPMVAGFVIEVALFLVWLLLPKERYVLEAGKRYADELLHAAVGLASNTGGSS